MEIKVHSMSISPNFYCVPIMIYIQRPEECRQYRIKILQVLTFWKSKLYNLNVNGCLCIK